MSVDLIKAFEPSTPEHGASERPVRESQFPKVLDSTLGANRSRASESAESKVSATEASANRPSESGRKTESRAESEASSGPAEGVSTPESAPARAGESGSVDAEEAADAAEEVASVDALASLSTSSLRASNAAEAEVDLEGRLTDLEARSGSGGPREPQIEAVSGDQPVSRELGEALLAEVEAGRAGQGAGQNAGQNGEPALHAAEQAEAPAEKRSESADASQAANQPLDEAVVRAAQEGGSGAAEVSSSQASEGAREANGDLRAAESVATVDLAQDDSADRDGRSTSDSGSDRSPEDDPRFRESASELERAADRNAPAEIDANLRAVLANQQGTERAPESAPIDGAGAIANPVAGTASAVTTTATPGTPTPPAASDAIAVQTEWLLTRGGGSARLTLHPQELGEISIRVTLRGDAVDVVMMAQEAATKGIAEDQAERLSQAFSSRDLRMENFEVRRGAAEDLPSGEERFAESGREQGASREGENGTPAHRRPGASAGSTRPEVGQNIAVLPRIMTVAPETGVDLRI